jgi:hypothetical protein
LTCYFNYTSVVSGHREFVADFEYVYLLVGAENWLLRDTIILKTRRHLNMASTEHDSKGGTVELAEKHSGSGHAEIDLQSEEDFNGAESRMSFAKWMACFALGLSYTTAIQQHSCTATIVKHIDIALGNFQDENVWPTDTAQGRRRTTTG